MGQFTGLFNGLKTTETKAKPKAKAIKNERNAEKQAKPTTDAPEAKSKTKTEEPRGSIAPEAAALVRGKGRHPDYTQAPAFIRKDTYKAVKIALINDERGLDYSELIEELLNSWLKSR